MGKLHGHYMTLPHPPQPTIAGLEPKLKKGTLVIGVELEYLFFSLGVCVCVWVWVCMYFEYSRAPPSIDTIPIPYHTIPYIHYAVWLPIWRYGLYGWRFEIDNH